MVLVSSHLPQLTPLVPDENGEVLVTVCSIWPETAVNECDVPVKQLAAANMQECWVSAAGCAVKCGTLF